MKDYQQKMLSIKFDNKDMYFVGDQFKTGDSTVSVLKISGDGKNIPYRVAFKIAKKGVSRDVTLSKYGYYIIDGNDALVVLDIYGEDPTAKSVTIGVCNPSLLPVKFNRLSLMAASLSPTQFIMKINGELTILGISKPYKAKDFQVRLTSVLTGNNFMERKASIEVKVVLKKGDEVKIGDKEFSLFEIEWNRAPSSRKCMIKRGLIVYDGAQGDDIKVGSKISIHISEIGENFVKLSFGIKNASLGEVVITKMRDQNG